MKTTGIVLDTAHQPGLAEPPATVLKDYSRWGSDGDFKADGHPDWVQLPSGLWVMDFDSSAPDYVEIPANQTQLNFTSGDFSLVIRMYVELTANRQIFMRGETNIDGYMFYVSFLFGRLHFRTNQAAANQMSESSVGAVVTGAWCTVGFSRSGVSAWLYRNGVDVTETHSVHIDPATCARSAKIGISDNLAGNPFGGKIGFLRIFNYALSAAQHRRIHDAWRNWV